MTNRSDATSTSSEVYHERQSLQLCALHVLNNMLQKKNAVTKQQLDEISRNLSPDSWMNPHRSPLGLGNYDVNVLIVAFQQNGLEVIWYDRRRDISKIRPSEVFGFVLNIPSPYRLLGSIPLLFSAKHWIAVRRIDTAVDAYYNLDSMLSKPECLGGETELLSFVKAKFADDKTQMLLVVTPDVAKSGKWEERSDDESLLVSQDSNVGDGVVEGNLTGGAN